MASVQDYNLVFANTFQFDSFIATWLLCLLNKLVRLWYVLLRQTIVLIYDQPYNVLCNFIVHLLKVKMVTRVVTYLHNVRIWDARVPRLLHEMHKGECCGTQNAPVYPLLYNA